MTEVSERYRRRADRFEQLVRSVALGQWSAPSPCARWTALDVVQHVVDMHHHIVTVAGRTPAAVPVADDPLLAVRVARAEIEALLVDPTVASTECETPAGPMTLEQQIDQVTSDDLPVHGWDLARATGQDDTIEAVDVERLWAVNTAVPDELMEKYRTPGAFGPGIEVYGPAVRVTDDAPLQERLLAHIGRDPGWSPWHTPVDSALLTGEDVEPLHWPEVTRALADAQSYWLATAHPNGAPQQRPVLAVWVEGALHTASAPGARKARNLSREPRCSVGAATPSIEFVLEGCARRVVEADRLERIAAAYLRKYGWPVTIVGTAFDAPYGAPTAGPPPYELYEIVATTVYAFGVDEDHAPRSTRWRFQGGQPTG